MPAEVPRLYAGFIPDTRTETSAARLSTREIRGDGGTEYTYAESQHHRHLERAPQHQRAAEHDATPCARACGGAVIQALAPGEQREEAEELRLDDERHVQVLRDHVDAQWERRDAPEEAAWGRSVMLC